MITTIAMFATTVAGMIGWFFAWRSRGEIVDARREIEEAIAGESAARVMAFESESRAVTAESQFSVERARGDHLQLQLDAERKSRQGLVDALAKAGVPVADAVLDSALDRLYPDDHQRGEDSDTDPGRDQHRVSGQPAAPAAPATKV